MSHIVIKTADVPCKSYCAVHVHIVVMYCNSIHNLLQFHGVGHMLCILCHYQHVMPVCTGQVGGYVEEYGGLTFSTVRNAGHMVPYTQPERAYHLFSHWIHGKEL